MDGREHARRELRFWAVALAVVVIYLLAVA